MNTCPICAERLRIYCEIDAKASAIVKAGIPATDEVSVILFAAARMAFTALSRHYDQHAGIEVMEQGVLELEAV